MFKFIVFITFTFIINNAFSSPVCGELLTHPGYETSQDGRHEYIIIPSGNGRDDDLIPKYRAFAERMSEPGGVLDQLGIPRTKQVIEFLSGVDMRAVTSTPAAQPMAHFWDGAQIVTAAANPRSLVYEVVFPGPDYHHGLYRDDNPFEQQLSIMMHVIGHNHFAVSSHFPHYRASNAPQSAVDFNKVMVSAYEVAPKEEVEAYYMFLQTLMSLDDSYSAFFRTPEDFKLDLEAELPDSLGDTEALKRHKALRSRGIKSPTESVLSAMVYRIQNSEAPKWQKDMATLLPKLAPYRPALVHTQVMNEGWASIMQEIIMVHMGPEYNTVNHWLSAMPVMETTDGLKIEDPYWLGVRAWKRLREKFNAREEIASLKTEIEKDRAFIKYATGIISSMDDFQFLNEALDDYMIQGMNMGLMRDATYEEAQSLPQPPQDMENPQPKIVTTRDPARIRRAIIHDAVSKKMIYRPRVKLSSFNRHNSGEIDLKIDDDFGNEMPIDKKTIAPALYSLAKSAHQTISFEAMFITTSKIEYPNPRDPFFGAPGFYNSQGQLVQNSSFGPPMQGSFQEMFFGPRVIESLQRLRLVVTPAGKLRVFLISEDNHEVELDPKDTDFLDLEEPLHEYQKQMFMEDDAQMEFFESENPRFDRFTMQAFNQLVNDIPMTSLIEHVPNAADAVAEYQAKVASRMAIAFDRAMNGHGGLVKTSKGLMLKALPSPKNIQFDGKYLEKMAKEASPEGVDQAMTINNQFDGDAVGSDIIGPVDIAPGGGGWAPGPGSGGKGKGEPSDGDPDDGDEPADGPEPGEDGLDPTWVPIPDSLYAQFLGERVKLPNLQPKSGSVKSQKLRLRSTENRRHGQLMVGPTAANALKKGLGAQQALSDEEGDGDTSFDMSEVDLLETLQLGFSLMRPRDFVVKKPKPINKPDTNAVVYFARDASGSTGPYTELYKRFVYDMKTLIKANYQNVKFVYIIFDTEAYIMKSEAEFFRAALGGGTSYKAGVDKVVEDMEANFPESDWDRFPFIIGDLGDWFTPETLESYETMISLSSYSGTVKGGYGVDDFLAGMEQLASDQPYFGFTNMGERPNGYTIDHIRELLKNDPEE